MDLAVKMMNPKRSLLQKIVKLDQISSSLNQITGCPLLLQESQELIQPHHLWQLNFGLCNKILKRTKGEDIWWLSRKMKQACFLSKKTSEGGCFATHFSGKRDTTNCLLCSSLTTSTTRVVKFGITSPAQLSNLKLKDICSRFFPTALTKRTLISNRSTNKRFWSSSREGGMTNFRWWLMVTRGGKMEWPKHFTPTSDFGAVRGLTRKSSNPDSPFQTTVHTKDCS